MGRVTVTSETAFSQTPEIIFDFVSNPANWGRTYKGSGGVHQDLKLPLKFGDTWTEKVELAPNAYVATWTLITVLRPRKFVFQQVGPIGRREDGSGGVDGICTISYTLEEVGQGVTLFTRSLCIELPKGKDIPDDLLTVSARPGGIDRYHSAIQAELENQFGNNNE